MTTPRVRPAGSIGFTDVARLVQEGVINADEAQQVIDLLVQKREAGEEPVITPQELPTTGFWERLRDRVVGVAQEEGERFTGVAGGLANMFSNIFGEKPIAEPRQVEEALGRATQPTRQPTEEPEDPPATTQPDTPMDAEELGASVVDEGQPSVGDQRTVPIPGGGELNEVYIPSRGGWVAESEVRELIDGGGDTPFDETKEGMEYEASLRRAEDAAQAGEERATRQIESQLEREIARKQRELEQQLQQQQIEAQNQRQQQQVASQLLGQLFTISSQPASRLRFLNAQAEGQSNLGQIAQARGLGGDQFTQLLNTAGLNPENQNFSVESRFAEMFGMQPGTQVDFAAPAGDTNIVPNLGQISDLSSEETQELDALTEILFGRRFSDIQRKSRELAPPGGNIQHLNVR